MNILVRDVPEHVHKALPMIAAHYGMRSSNEVILWALGAFTQTVRENDTLLDAAIQRAGQAPDLPGRVKVKA